MSRRVFAYVAATLLGVTLLVNVVYVAACGNGLSPFADPYSEACVVRAGERFALKGVFENYGLPDPTFGDRFPGKGITHASGSRPDDPIYHGYPPGSEWLGGLYTTLLGPGHLGRFRVFPVAFALIASATFLAGLTRALGPWRASLIYVACLATPMFTAMSHGLYYQGYALSLLLIQLALLVNIFGPAGTGRVSPTAVAALFFLGLLQGFLSFDFCFVLTFAAVPIALVMAEQGRPVSWWKVMIACIAAGTGFVAAHGVRFAESALYLGSVRAALDEYAFRSRKQYGVAALIEGNTKAQIYLSGLVRYGRAYMRWTHLFSLPGELLVVALATVLVLRRATLSAGRWVFEAVMKRPEGRKLAGLAAALAIGFGWLFAKPAHAVNHLYFTGRHLFLFYLIGWLVIARLTTIHITRNRPDPHTSRGDGTVPEREREVAEVLR